jgi:hypothetical protein
MRREDLLPDDKTAIDESDILEDMMLNSRGYAIIKEWMMVQKRKALKIEAIDLTKPAEEIKILIAKAQVMTTMMDDLEKFIVRRISFGKELKSKLLIDSGQGE